MNEQRTREGEIASLQVSKPISCDTSLHPHYHLTFTSDQLSEYPTRHLIMPAARTTKTKAAATPLDTKTTQPIKRPHQRKARNTANSSEPPDSPEPAISTAPTAPTGGRKSRKKATAPTGSTDVAMEELQPKASKRKRQLTNDTLEATDNLPLKRSKGTPAANAGGAKHKRGRPPKEVQTVQLPPARPPLPDRIVRNTHPATPKGTCRSSKQVAADNAAKNAAEMKLLKEQIHLGEMAKLQFAQMQIDEEHADVEMRKRNPTRLSTVKRINQPVSKQDESTDGEEFDFDKVGDTTSSESEIIVQPVHKRKVSFNQEK